jgi:hypothetical protein
MSDEWAELDYEPTPDEIRGAFEFGSGSGHGQMILLPTMERYIWNQEGVFWGHRVVREDGLIEFAWLKP